MCANDNPHRFSRPSPQPELPDINCEYPCDELVRAAYRVGPGQERNLLLGFVLQYFDLWIGRGTEQQLRTPHVHEALLSLVFCLLDPLCQRTVWDWFSRVLDEASAEDSQRIALDVGVVSILFEDPIEWKNDSERFVIQKLFEKAKEPGKSWILTYPYEGWSARKFLGDVEAHNDWCHKSGDVAAVLDQQLVERILQETTFMDEDEDEDEEDERWEC